MIGVSFGGIVAIELSKYCNPQKIILISSVENSNQLPRTYLPIGKIKLLNWVPDLFIKPPKLIQSFLFGAKNHKLLNEIISDTNPSFIRWALHVLINWSNQSNSIETIRIYGTNDKLIPLKGDAIKINNGGHFIIVDNADEISKLINDQMK